jgi:hypothetical protein
MRGFFLCLNVAGLWLKIEIWGFFLNNGIFVNIYETGATTLF